MNIDIDEVKNKFIIIDTNIFIYTVKATFKERSGGLLGKLIKNGNKLYISDITCLELMSTISDTEREAYHKIITHPLIHPIPILTQILVNASVLSREYYKFGMNRREEKNKKYNDLIIAGTVAIIPDELNPLLLTCDRDDFREPLWVAESYFGVTGNSSDEIKENVYLLKLCDKLISTERKPKRIEDKQKVLINKV